MAAAALGPGTGSANAVGPARAGLVVEAAAAQGQGMGSANAQLRAKQTEIMCPAQKWLIPDTVSCPCGTDEPLSVAAPRSKGRPATESKPSAKVARTRPSAK